MTGFKRLIALGCIVLLLVNAFACGRTSYQYDYSDISGDAEDAKDFVQDAQGEYILIETDDEKDAVRLYNVELSCLQTFSFSGSTYVLDSYGDVRTWDLLETGDAVSIVLKSGTDQIETIQKSPNAWGYSDIDEFEITKVDDSMQYITVMNHNYEIAADVLVFKDGQQISLSDLSTMDVISVTGYNNVVDSIIVESAHGTLTLSGTDDFVGGWLCLGNILSTVISRDMSLDVQAGTYVLSAANNGKGGSTKVTIIAGEETVYNLNDLNSDNSNKISIINFHISPDDTILSINGKEYDYSSPIKLKYGTYKLTLFSSDYGTVTRILIASSQKASISFDMKSMTESDDSDSSSDTSTVTTTDDTSADSSDAETDGTGAASGNTAKEDTTVVHHTTGGSSAE